MTLKFMERMRAMGEAERFVKNISFRGLDIGLAMKVAKTLRNNFVDGYTSALEQPNESIDVLIEPWQQRFVDALPGDTPEKMGEDRFDAMLRAREGAFTAGWKCGVRRREGMRP